ncbi:MAG: ParB/RepB/Spo0J family partition protein [Pseudomonadota bacterium]|nr:ParB/RepB/Spo0J family partition protein [Pseudomonadota bacterium]
MNIKKRGLGRGLNDLGLNELLSSVNTAIPKMAEELRRLPVEYLQASQYQPRKDFDPEHLQELADSIRAQGIIQPILARKITHNRYEIIAGERRWRAAQLAGLQEVPVVIRDINDDAAVAMALIENIQREDLNAIEEAHALQRLIDEFSMTHAQVSEAVGKSRASVTNLLRLLQLHDDVKTMVERGDLEMGHARAMLSLSDDLQIKAAQVVISQGLSVRETESYIRRLQQPANVAAAPRSIDPDTLRLQNTLSDKFGAPVKISHQSSGKGKLTINYHSLDELDGILQQIGVQMS